MARIKSQRSARPPIRNKETRGAILAAAGRIFAKFGLAGARIDAIAAAASVNKALLYYYFKSKEGMYEAVVEDHFCEFNRKAMEVLNAPGSARAVFVALCEPAPGLYQRTPSVRPALSAVDDDGREIPGTTYPAFISRREATLWES